MSASLATTSSSRRNTFLAVALLLATLLAYWPALHAGYIWDDDDYLTENPHLHDAAGFARFWTPGHTKQYYPIVFTTFWIEHQFWGLHPLGYHLINILIHVANALLIWRLLTVLNLAGRSGLLGFTIAAVFALHPVHVESVAWITERKNTLSALFYLLAALTYLRFDAAVFEPRAVERRSPSPLLLWLTALACFTFALLSKSITCSLPAALILMLILRGRRLSLRRLLPLAPFFALGLALALHTAALERTSVGAVGHDFAFSFADRLLIASRALLFYPFKLLVPHPLVFIYPRWEINDAILFSYWPLAIVAPVAIVSLIVLVRSRNVPFRSAAVALCFFAGSIFPALGFFNVYPMLFSFVADHFNYLPSISLIALFVTAAAALIRHAPAQRIIAGATLAALAALTFNQSRMYHDEQTLWATTIQRNPSAWIAHNNLGLIVRRTGDLEAALAHFNAAIAVKSDLHRTRANIAETLRMQGRHEEALAQLEIANQLAIAHYGRPPAEYQQRLAYFLDVLNRPDEAIAAYRRAAELDPRDVASPRRAAELLLLADRADEAAPLFEQVLRLEPSNVAAHMALADHHARAGRHAQSILHARAGADAAINAAHEIASRETDPASSQLAAAVEAQIIAVRALARQLAASPDPAVRSPRESLALMEELIAITPNDPFALDVLAMALAASARFDEAITTTDQAIQRAVEHNLHDLARDLAQRRMAYQAHQPWIDHP